MPETEEGAEVPMTGQNLCDSKVEPKHFFLHVPPPLPILLVVSVFFRSVCVHVIHSLCSDIPSLPGKSGLRLTSSAKMQPTLHISTERARKRKEGGQDGRKKGAK